MINFKNSIANYIAESIATSTTSSENLNTSTSTTTNIDVNQIETYIEVPKDGANGDYAFPCFKLAKDLKKAPPIIANEIKQNIKVDNNLIEKIEVVGGYLNFYINKELLAKETLQEIQKTENYGSSNIGQGKNIIVEYSSPNIAKQFHIGHLRTTVIGAALYNIYKYLGYNTIGMNHLGDYGTQFGKLIEGYKRWGEEYNLEENPIEELTKIYVRINEASKEDESILEACRENFRLLEEHDKYATELWEKFRDLSLKEFQRIYDLLGVKFDAVIGESFYTDKMQNVENLLEQAGVLTDSEGAKIVDLEDKGLGVCIIKKANGSSIYATRDLAAIKYRAETYDFDKCLYVVAYEQALHFKQIFEVAKYLQIPEKCVKGLEHVQYGMTRLATGRMSTREGNVVKVEDLLNEAIQRVEKVIEDKNANLENKKEEATKIGIGAVIFNNLASTIIKDQVFDWDNVLNFQGETGPYIQYTYVRTQSVLEKAQATPSASASKNQSTAPNAIPNASEIDIKLLTDELSISVLKLIYNFNDILIQVTEKNDPSILSRYLIDLSKSFSTFYNENKIICEDENVQKARVYLTFAVGKVLKIGAKLLGIEMPSKM